MVDGISKTRLYSIFSGMKQRCYNPNATGFEVYGGKGIAICDEWMGEGGLYKFIEWALDNGYADNLTIDRVNSDGPYSPGNCRWISAEENSKRVFFSKAEIAEEILENNAIQELKSFGYTVSKHDYIYQITTPHNYPLCLLFLESLLLFTTMVKERDGAGGPQEATGAAAVAGGISLPPDALKAAQRAAERTGEAVVDFLARAAQAQAKRDEISLHMGLNPATGGKLDSKGGADHE